MLSIQGTKLNGINPIKVKKKKEINISLFFGKKKSPKRFDETKYHNEISEIHTDSFLLLSKNYKDRATPNNDSSVTITPKCLSKTPTSILIKKNHKFSIQRYEFDPPINGEIHNNSYFDENKRCLHSKSSMHRKALKTQEFGIHFHKTEKRTRGNRNIRKDPSMNLPAVSKIIKQKKRTARKITLLEILS
ncbi:hypothetical protein SteCoe_16652 [Stentor coeruleus]|uniref:Uncharacterized protein n=1 Tax=Stentor coeruleus TaxID=5963 RepID=A0A1R2C102_9CILI|nr:hypothetical protein SteCoe_16652 [Stentor coeruleus]